MCPWLMSNLKSNRAKRSRHPGLTPAPPPSLLVGGTVTPEHWYRDLKLSEWRYSEPWSRSQPEYCMLTGKQLIVHEHGRATEMMIMMPVPVPVHRGIR